MVCHQKDQARGEEAGMMISEVRNIFTIVEMEARRLRHDYTDIIVRSLQPILWLLVFGNVFSRYRVIPTGGYTYMQFVAPGILAQSVLFIAIFFGIMLVWDRDSGNLSKILVAPVSRFSIIMGKCLSAGVRAIAQAVVVLVLILIIGVPLTTNPIYYLLVIPVVVLIAAVSAGISILFASLFRTRERVMGIGQLLTMPLFFTSNALYPIEMMPDWLRYIAWGNPLTYGVDILRALMLTGDFSHILVDLGVLLGYLIVLTSVCSILLKRIME